MVDEAKPSNQELLFLHVISMFQAAAMQQLGKIMDPVTGKVATDLDQAKVSIDILDVLKEKTRGNLTKSEADFLDKVLFELHMNYVEEAKQKKEAKEEDADEGDEEKEASAGEPEQKNNAESVANDKGNKGKAKDQEKA